MRVCRSVLVRRDPEDVFALIADVARYPEFFRGMTRWEPVTDQVAGIGAGYRVLMQVGSIEAGGVIRTTEWDEPRTIAWTSERGTRQSGRWTVEPVADGSRVTLEVGFFLAGPLRWPVERLAGRIIGRNIHATLLAARRLLERGEHVRAS
jgi:ribosome-associated toxin RatA of RatAB toxin-antitoxin module